MLAGSQLLIVVDATIVTVALGSISADLGLGAAELHWILTAYLLTFGGFLLLGGRLADRVGRRRTFVIGMGGFGVGSLVAGLATAAFPLFAGRALQGLSAALLAPAALSLLMTVFPPGRDRDRALAVWGGVSAAGTAIGLILGGVLTQLLSWEWIFLVTLPITAIVVPAAGRLLPAGGADRTGRFDLAGAVLVTLGLGGVVYSLVQSAATGWTARYTWLVALVAVVLLAAFALLQARPGSLLPVRLLRDRTLLAGNGLGFVLCVAIYALFYFVSLFLGTVLGHGPVATGLAFLPMAVAVAAGSAAGGWALSRIGARAVLIVAFTSVALALALLARITPAAGYLDVVLPGSLLAGGGLGLAFVALVDAAVGVADPADSGIAAALFNAVQQVGGAVGLAVLTAVGTAVTTSARVGPDSPPGAALTRGWSVGFLVAAGITASGVVIALAVRRGSRPAPASPRVPGPGPGVIPDPRRPRRADAGSMSIVPASTRVPVVPVLATAVGAQLADDVLFLVPPLGLLGPLAGVSAIVLTAVAARMLARHRTGAAAARTGLAVGGASALIGLVIGGLGLVTVLLAGLTVLAGVAGASGVDALRTRRLP